MSNTAPMTRQEAQTKYEAAFAEWADRKADFERGGFAGTEEMEAAAKAMQGAGRMARRSLRSLEAIIGYVR